MNIENTTMEVALNGELQLAYSEHIFNIDRDSSYNQSFIENPAFHT